MRYLKPKFLKHAMFWNKLGERTFSKWMECIVLNLNDY
jgi:hypothetical protein